MSVKSKILKNKVIFIFIALFFVGLVYPDFGGELINSGNLRFKV